MEELNQKFPKTVGLEMECYFIDNFDILEEKTKEAVSKEYDRISNQQ